MRSLRELQLAFGENLLGAHRVSPREQVYRNNVFLSLSGALADVYPVVKRLVGEPFFAQMARRFVRMHPSRSGNLHEFGRELGHFVSTIPDLRPLAYLPDVAALEWAYHEVFHAAEAAPLDFTKVRDPENARLRVHPAVRLVASSYPILAIWEANQPQVAEPGVINIDAGGDFLIVLRQRLQRDILQSTPGEFALLGALAQGLTLGDACDAAVAAEPGLDLAAAMGRLVNHGIFSEGVQA